MAPNDSAETTGEAADTVVGRRKAARYIVPVAVAGVAAATIGLVPALANSGDPDLPKISAQELIEKIAASDEEQLSGTFKISTDLGLPLDGLAGSLVPGGEGRGGDKDAGAAAPQDKLMELTSGTHTLRVAADGPSGRSSPSSGTRPSTASSTTRARSGRTTASPTRSTTPRRPRAGTAAATRRRPRRPPRALRPPRRTLAEQALAAAGETTSVTVDGTAQVAGRTRTSC